MKKWLFYVFILGFSIYWASNLILWFPWSYNATLGITLMLTLTPLLWAYVTYLAMRTFPGPTVLRAAFIIGFVFLLQAAIMDYIFFGHIRNAMEALYHPTTFYGYAFLVIWPFILAYPLKSRIMQSKKSIQSKDLIQPLIIGLFCFGVLFLVIISE